MRVDQFDFDLPEERIALHPAEPRDAARMLVVLRDGTVADRQVTDLLQILRAGDVLVVNDTKVIPARLSGTRLRGDSRRQVSFNLHRRIDGNSWLAFSRPAKHLQLLDVLELGRDVGGPLDAIIAGKGENGEVTLAFALSGAALDEAIKTSGAMPLPPYIGGKREVEPRDASDYQTVYATVEGAVLLSFVALAVTIAYPYAKRFVSMPQAVLGVAFSFGIPMAFAAATGGRDWSLASIPAAVPALAWWLLGGNLFWVLAYDTEYAMVDRDDDLKIGIRTSAITLGRFDVAGVMAFYAIYLLSWLYLGLKLGLGPAYAVGIVIAALQAAWHFTLIWGRTREGCFRAFRANHWVGAAVFAGVALSFVVGGHSLR